MSNSNNPTNFNSSNSINNNNTMTTELESPSMQVNNSLMSFITPFNNQNNDPTTMQLPADTPSNINNQNNDPTINITTPFQPTVSQNQGGGKGRRKNSTSSTSSQNNSSKRNKKHNHDNINTNNNTATSSNIPTGPAVTKGNAVTITAEITQIPALSSSSSSTSTSTNNSSSTTKKSTEPKIDNNAINVLVSLTAPDEEDTKQLERAPLNLLCVLDRSGSMEGEKNKKFN